MICKKDINIIKSILGDDFLDDLAKSDVGVVINLKTQTGVAPEEIRIALQIVPRAILSYLFANLKWRVEGEPFELDLPFAPGAKMMAEKKGPDSYSGEIIQEGTRLTHFKNRALPSVGLILLSTFELYDMALLDEIKEQVPKADEADKIDKLQDMIDQKLMMHRLVQDVVDRRMSEREAIDRVIKDRLHDHIVANSEPKEEESMEQAKKSRLREFLESREQRKQEPVELDKGEVNCPDCNTVLHKNEEKAIKLCICYGQFHNKEIKFKKSDDGKVNLKFPKSFDMDNIEMLLDALKNK
jgi:hypothetical protein